MKTTLHYGKSMYGGWYAHSADMGLNIHSSSLDQLKQRAKELNCVLKYRFDN